MSVMVEVRDVGISFPRKRAVLGTIEHSIKRTFGGAKIEEFVALDSVSFDVNEGEVVGIIGHNGAGKSTLLRVLAGIYRPDRGRVRIGGEVSLLAGLGVGFNVQLSGRENIYLYGSILGKPRHVMDKQIDEIIAFAELEEFIEEPLRTYSSGMRARLGFAVAQAMRPEILMIDEVLAVGDARFQERSTRRIKEMTKEAGCVIVASHSFAHVREVCNRVLLFEKGKLIADASAQDAIDEYLKDESEAVRRLAEAKG